MISGQRRQNAVFLVLLVTGGLAGCAPRREGTTQPAPRVVKLTVSKLTTYVSGPCNKDGTINYVTHLNDKYGKGVTPDNNAAVLLLRALGPETIEEELRDRTLELLDIRSLPPDGDYLRQCDPPGAELEWERRCQAREKQQRALDQATKRPWAAKDHPWIAAWLARNQRPLELVTAAARRPRFFVPLVSRSDPPFLLDVGAPRLGWRRLLQALLARAMMRFHGGHADAAWADVMTLRRLARLIAHQPGAIGRLVGMGMESAGCDACITIATSGNLTGAQARAFLAELSALPKLPGFLEAVRNERLTHLDCVMFTARGVVETAREPDLTTPAGRKWARDQFDWDSMLRACNEWEDRRIQACSKTPAGERAKAISQLKEQELRYADAFYADTDTTELARQLTPDLEESMERARMWVSRKLANLFACIRWDLSLGAGLDGYDAALAKANLARAAMALATCKAETGRYPARLEGLKPRYLREIPPDVLSGKPLIYRPAGAGYVLYSVGRNLKDDGGKQGPVAPATGLVAQPADIVVRVD